jgi:hypothetical protein
MKPIEQNEIFEHFSQFLKNRGIELKDGSYAKGIQKGCTLLADAINLSQRGIEKAKSGIDQKLAQMRQVVHERTAPKSATAPRSPQTAAKAASGKAKVARKKPNRSPRSSGKRSKRS